MTKLFSHYKRGCFCRGFTLLELSIVLSVAGVLIGAVWIATSSMWSGYKISKASQQVSMVTQNIREYASRSSGLRPPTAATGCADLTADLDRLGLFPSEMRRFSGAGLTVRIDSPFNSTEKFVADPNASGSFAVVGLGCDPVNPTTSTLASRFRIVLTHLKQSDCIRMLMSGINYRDQTIGVYAVCASAETAGTRPCYSGAALWRNILCFNGACEASPVPITLALAQGLCSDADINEVGWEMRVHEGTNN